MATVLYPHVRCEYLTTSATFFLTDEQRHQLMSVCFGFVSTYSQAMGVRFLLGLFEAGMLPGIAYYMSRWYRKAELAFRLALYVVTAPLVSGATVNNILVSTMQHDI